MVSLRILLIEDVEDDYQLILRELERSGYKITHLRVDTPANLLHALIQKKWDLVLCDYSMLHMDGDQALKIIRAANPVIPVVFVSGTMDGYTKTELQQVGAQGYITKNNLSELGAIVRAVTR